MKLGELKDIDEGFMKNAAAAALVATAMSGTYGYDKLLRDQDPDEVEAHQEHEGAQRQQSNRSKARLIAAAKKSRSRRMNPKASKTENMPQSGSRPSDIEASQGSTTYGSRYSGSTSGVNDG